MLKHEDCIAEPICICAIARCCLRVHPSSYLLWACASRLIRDPCFRHLIRAGCPASAPGGCQVCEPRGFPRGSTAYRGAFPRSLGRSKLQRGKGGGVEQTRDMKLDCIHLRPSAVSHVRHRLQCGPSRMGICGGLGDLKCTGRHHLKRWFRIGR